MLLYPILIVCFFSGLLAWKFSWRGKRRVAQWRAALNLKKHQQMHYQLYANVDAFSLSRHARLDGDALEYVYGESDFESFIAVLSLCQLGQETIFYDLGSGVGKLVIACAMVFDIKKSCGIELFQGLHDCAKLQWIQLKQEKDYRNQMDKVTFSVGDVRNHPFDDATLIFINASALLGESWLTMSAHIANQVKQGTIVISTSKQVASTDFLLVKVTKMRMSWGIVQTFIQKKK